MDTLNDLLDTRGFLKGKKVQEAKTLFGSYLKEMYPHADFRTAVYLELNKQDHPQCSHPDCQKYLQIQHFTTGFPTYCSVKCKNQSPMGVQGSSKTKGHEATKKRKETTRMKYGVDHISQVDAIQEQKKATFQERYGVDHFMQDPERANKVSAQRVKNWLPNRLKQIQSIKLITSVDEYQNCFTDLQWQCNECEHTFWQNLRDGRIPQCPKCKPKSFPEDEINNFIRSLGYETKRHDRTAIKPKEIDIMVPSMNFGIEFDGLWYHRNYDQNYHLNKTIDAQNNGIKLIHIFEDEWIHTPEIVKSKLKHQLNCTDNIKYARKLELKTVDTKTRKEFFQHNHIQQNAPASIAYGLFENNELIICASFIKSRYDKRANYECVRMATKLEYQVVGGCSKLINYANKELGSLISYADRRWSDENSYQGWQHIGSTAPGYFWCKTQQRIPRYRTSKSKLKNLPNYDETKSETEIMTEAGYWKIWDCGHHKFFLPSI